MFKLEPINFISLMHAMVVVQVNRHEGQTTPSDAVDYLEQSTRQTGKEKKGFF